VLDRCQTKAAPMKMADSAAGKEEGKALKGKEKAPRPHPLLYGVLWVNASARRPWLGLPGGHFSAKAAPDAMGVARRGQREDAGGAQGIRPTPQLHLCRPIKQARSYAPQSEGPEPEQPRPDRIRSGGERIC
jgi:hypothetical protein